MGVYPPWQPLSVSFLLLLLLLQNLTNKFFFFFLLVERSPAYFCSSSVAWALDALEFCDIFVDEGIVMQKLEKLRDDKAEGADELVPLYLNLTKQELAFVLTILFHSIMVSELSES